VKRRPACAAISIAAPSLALPHPRCPIDLAIPDLPKCCEGGQSLVECARPPIGPMAGPRDPIDLGGPMCPTEFRGDGRSHSKKRPRPVC
jgi:hypothetical protein